MKYNKNSVFSNIYRKKVPKFLNVYIFKAHFSILNQIIYVKITAVFLDICIEIFFYKNILEINIAKKKITVVI